jgi:septum site-determining protein MinC
MNARRSQARSDAFEIDFTVAPVTVLRLKTADVAQIEKDLRARIASVQQMFPYAPVVVDMAELDATSALELPLHDLADRLRACKLVPVGAANLPPSAVWNAAAAGMAVVQLAAPRVQPVESTRPEPPREAPPSSEAPPPQLPASTMTVRRPVRSGQVIYAQRADLIVLAPVNAGAQVIADGNIHVYGPLRGRAMAGAQGMADACVFCLSLEAELVSVAGQYLLADEIPAERRGSPTQLYVENGHFRIEPL